MQIILQSKTWYLIGVVIAVLFIIFFVARNNHSTNDNLVTAIVSRDDIEETVAVSGFIESKHTADLSFPVTGTVTEVYAEEGNAVRTGEVLATLASNQLVASRNEALAALRGAQAQYTETVTGPTDETKSVTEAKVQNAENNLAQVTAEYDKRVANARQALLSDGLEARATNPKDEATPPTISGTYTCTQEGSYVIDVYNSGAASGYSYTLSGLESGTDSVYVDQPDTLGTCGLYIQFVDGEKYGNTNWVVDVPNTRSENYLTYKNTYELALKQQASAVDAAQNVRDLALKEADLTLADARSEVVTQKQAAVNQQYARIAAIDAQLADRSIVAPFDSVVTDVSILEGETATLEPVITVLADGGFELTARVPEIDIIKVAVGQKAAVTFDAKSDTALSGTVTFVSPVATEIDGVAYFKTTITLDETPDWIRAGLNADIDIIVDDVTDSLRIPKRFLITEGDATFVLLRLKGDDVKTPVTVAFTGNDGYVAIENGLNEGDEIVAPQQ